ncbi:hypothetical protein C1646_684151 [Rhizophagus diaphanus]|nr:hypothetical protein C1646_684151 [Rhizophagus diaphanus] [Rhizophagus sp. MUCL 43196]
MSSLVKRFLNQVIQIFGILFSLSEKSLRNQLSKRSGNIFNNSKTLDLDINSNDRITSSLRQFKLLL